MTCPICSAEILHELSDCSCGLRAADRQLVFTDTDRDWLLTFGVAWHIEDAMS